MPDVIVDSNGVPIEPGHAVAPRNNLAEALIVDSFVPFEGVAGGVLVKCVWRTAKPVPAGVKVPSVKYEPGDLVHRG